MNNFFFDPYPTTNAHLVADVANTKMLSGITVMARTKGVERGAWGHG